MRGFEEKQAMDELMDKGELIGPNLPMAGPNKHFKVEGQIADLVQNDLNQALKYYSMMTPKIEAGKANKQEMDAYELLGYYLNQAAPKAQNVAYGGRVDKALGGRVRDI